MMMLNALWWRRECWPWQENHPSSLNCTPAFRPWYCSFSSHLISSHVISFALLSSSSFLVFSLLSSSVLLSSGHSYPHLFFISYYLLSFVRPYHIFSSLLISSHLFSSPPFIASCHLSFSSQLISFLLLSSLSFLTYILRHKLTHGHTSLLYSLICSTWPNTRTNSHTDTHTWNPSLPIPHNAA